MAKIEIKNLNEKIIVRGEPIKLDSGGGFVVLKDTIVLALADSLKGDENEDVILTIRRGRLANTIDKSTDAIELSVEQMAMVISRVKMRWRIHPLILVSVLDLLGEVE